MRGHETVADYAVRLQAAGDPFGDKLAALVRDAAEWQGWTDRIDEGLDDALLSDRPDLDTYEASFAEIVARSKRANVLDDVRAALVDGGCMSADDPDDYVPLLLAALFPPGA